MVQSYPRNFYRFSTLHLPPFACPINIGVFFIIELTVVLVTTAGIVVAKETVMLS